MKVEPIEFAELPLSDARIKDVRLHIGSVEVDYVDWQEHLHTLHFREAIGCLMMSPHGRDLSHGCVDREGAYLRQCCEAAGHEAAGAAVFNFVDAWSELKVIQIVAKDVVRVA